MRRSVVLWAVLAAVWWTSAGAQIIPYQGPPYTRTKALANNTPTVLLTVAVPSLGSCNVFLVYQYGTADAANSQTHTGSVALAAVATSAGAVTATIGEETEQVAASSGTVSDSWTTTTGTNSATITASFNSTLGAGGVLQYSILHPITCAVTFS